ncbi:MAG TPA: hypothetical protein VEA99_21345 [Gemmatimonadaceae bacterium]|nr:hypothetical protein [Gemmatimonadaceae bacterium]
MPIPSRRTLPVLLLVVGAATVQAQSSSGVPERWRSLDRLPRSGSAEMGRLLDDLSTARVDAWALVRQLAPRAAVPASATYHPECSAAHGVPTALFSLGTGGTEATDGALADMAGAVRAGSATPQDRMRQFEMMSRVAHATNTAPGVQEAVSFYRRRGARLGTVTTHYPLSWNEDEPGRALHVVVRGRNPYAAGPHAACRAMPRGPMLELSVR